jgi:hypothetical protein
LTTSKEQSQALTRISADAGCGINPWSRTGTSILQELLRTQLTEKLRDIVKSNGNF